MGRKKERNHAAKDGEEFGPEDKTMIFKFDKVVELLMERLAENIGDDYIQKPMANALYKVWKEVDKEETPRKRGDRVGD